MQGELGTSHCYEWEGDYPTTNEYHQGYLGADLVWDKANQGYRIEKIIRGDEWKPTQDSPLATLGSKIAPKEIILKVGGRPVSPEMTVERLLVNQNEKPVSLTIKAIDGVVRQETVVALKSETLLRYRAWVNENRDYVHRQSGGKVGYLHIPDMDHWGIREFRRGFLEERGYDGLVVDLRFNRGGNVSQIIMEELRRKVIGYDVSRWSGPSTYPSEAHAGPKVGITNEFAGSDGDIGSHAFKMYGIGPLVGKRTWGGVIGIWPKHQLVDGTTTTQPEYAFWFSGGAGWSLENLGTTPDHDVDIAPHHYAGNEDPQLDKAIELILAELEANPVKLPDFQSRPSKALPFTERSTTSGVSKRKKKPNVGKTKQRKGVY
jgi:tricorn protease